MSEENMTSLRLDHQIELKNRKGRNSNVEILRIFAMFCILLNHFPWNTKKIVGNGGYFHRFLPYLTESFLMNFGGIGDCLFFFISVWYLCEETPNLKRSCKRAWILERELLFWSLTLFAVYILTTILHISEPFSAKIFLKYTLQAFFPTTMDHWWFPTSYILFLLFLPALCTGLKLIGRIMHRDLVFVLLLAFSLLPFSALERMVGWINMTYSVWLFVYQFTIVSYLRWYRRDLLNSKHLMRLAVFIGLGLGILSQVVSVSLLLPIVGSLNLTILWMNSPACLPCMMFAIGLISLAQQKSPRYNQIINKIASSVFAVYLILTTASMHALLANFINGLNITSWALMLTTFLIACAFFVTAICLDLIRQGLFALTCDRNRGHWFELAWNKAGKQIKRIQERVTA